MENITLEPHRSIDGLQSWGVPGASNTDVVAPPKVNYLLIATDTFILGKRSRVITTVFILNILVMCARYS